MQPTDKKESTLLHADTERGSGVAFDLNITLDFLNFQKMRILSHNSAKWRNKDHIFTNQSNSELFV